MTPYAMGPVGRADLANIHRFTKRRWGGAQADAYVEKLFARFQAIADGKTRSRRMTSHPELYVCACAQHFVYWRRLPSGMVGIVTILHQHMVQADRVRVAVETPF